MFQFLSKSVGKRRKENKEAKLKRKDTKVVEKRGEFERHKKF